MKIQLQRTREPIALDVHCPLITLGRTGPKLNPEIPSIQSHMLCIFNKIRVHVTPGAKDDQPAPTPTIDEYIKFAIETKPQRLSCRWWRCIGNKHRDTTCRG